jgi:branched-chain amino acid transport system permease protein
VDRVLQAAADGLVVGAMVGLIALGLTLVFGIAKFANVAQGDFATVPAYVALTLQSVVGGFLLAAGLAIVAGTSVVIAVYVLAYRRLARSTPVALLVTSIGVALALRAIISLIWGVRLQAYDLPIARGLVIGPIRLTPTDIAILVSSSLVVAATYMMLYRTRAGIEMRAVADEPDLARVSGINSRRVITLMWIANGVLVSIGGILLGTKAAITPLLGWNILLPAFAATILGGIGSPIGAVAGGIIIGVTTEIAALILNPAYKQAVAFIVLAAVLLWRPRGLLAA